MNRNKGYPGSILTGLPPQSIHFQRRERLQLPSTGFWQIVGGFIVASILNEEGNLIPLGIWSKGDLLGYSLACHASIEVESITQATVLSIAAPSPEQLLHQSLRQLKQTQTLLTLRQGPVIDRIEGLLIWLAQQFGEMTEDGILINLRLTHQMIADFVGSTRVTTTRLLQQLQRDGILSCQKGHVIYFSKTEIQRDQNSLEDMQFSYNSTPLKSA